MNALYSFFAVLALIVIAMLGAGAMGWHTLFGVIIPYAAIIVFFGGVIVKVLGWARTPVPFKIPTTAGQQRSLYWIKPNTVENPSTTSGVITRMALEVLLFRSLFRNLAAEKYNSEKGVDAVIGYASSKWLWVFALMFHYSFLIIFLRHFRLFSQPVPAFVTQLEFWDGLLQIGLPSLYITDLLLVAGVTLLLLRRLVIPQMRFLSLAADYFPLLLILSIAITGILMRYFTKTDITAVQELAVSFFALNPSVPEGLSTTFYIHLFLVSVLLMYFPFSKLMHMPGVFMSPTRNTVNDTRFRYHANPWNRADVKAHTYEAYEDEFREKMAEVGLPLDKPLEEAGASEEEEQAGQA
jgi:nitrate reductase gamma subunit